MSRIRNYQKCWKMLIERKFEFAAKGLLCDLFFEELCIEDALEKRQRKNTPDNYRLSKIDIQRLSRRLVRIREDAMLILGDTDGTKLRDWRDKCRSEKGEFMKMAEALILPEIYGPEWRQLRL